MKLLPPKRTFYKGGHIYWDGTDILPWPEEKLNTLRGSDMAMVFQDPMTALNPVLTIGDQITEGIRSNERVTKKRRTNGRCLYLRIRALRRQKKASSISP